MKKLIAVAVLSLLLGVAVGFAVANSRTQELKKQDEAIFKTYRDGLGLASETLGCFGDVPCIDDKTEKIDELVTIIGEQLTAREELVGAENE